MTYTDIEAIFSDLKEKFLAEEAKDQQDQNIMSIHMNDLDEILGVLHDIVEYSPTDEEIISTLR